MSQGFVNKAPAQVKHRNVLEWSRDRSLQREISYAIRATVDTAIQTSQNGLSSTIQKG